MLFNFKVLELFPMVFIFIFSLNSNICQTKHCTNIKLREIPLPEGSSFYDKLLETLRPVLERTNLSVNNALEHEIDYDYSNQDKPDVEEPPTNIFENIHNISSKKSNLNYRLSRHGDSVPLTKRDITQKSKYYNSHLTTVGHHSNKSLMASSEHEVDYDYRNQDKPDIEEPPAPIFQHGRVNNTGQKQPGLQERLNHKTALSQKIESLYEKYKTKLNPYVHNLNVTPGHHHHLKGPSEFYLKEKLHLDSLRRRSSNLSTPSEYNSLYDEFKKRLIDFSTDLDIDAGLTDDSNSPLDFTRETHQGMGHVTAEFRKVQSIVDHSSGKDISLIPDHRKSYQSNKLQNRKSQPLHPRSKKSSLLKPTNVVEEDYGKDHNYQIIYSGRQPVTSGGFINSDYNYDDSYHPLPIFRKPEVPLETKKRPLRGVESIDNSYLGLNYSPGTDGAFHNSFFPSIYTDSISRELGNLTVTSLLETIAHKLNMSTLEVAQKVVAIKGLNVSTLKQDPELCKLLQQYIENSVVSAAQASDVTRNFQTNSHFDKGTPNDISTLKISDSAYEAPKINMEFHKEYTKMPSIQQTLSSQTTFQSPENIKQDQWEDILKTLQQQATEIVKSNKEELTMPKPISLNKNGEVLPTLQNPLTHDKNTLSNGKMHFDDSPVKVTTGKPLDFNNNIEVEATMQKFEDFDKNFEPRPSYETSNKTGLSPEQVSLILDKLTNRLEEIQFEKSNEDVRPLEDAACKLNGSWQSKVMGLRFDITLDDHADHNMLPREARNQVLNITVRECTPPRPHDIIETDWPVRGNALNVNGGPFFLYAQKRSENLLGTFVGYCRNCGGVDTIYGTWCFSFPSKNCQDTPASFQTKNDVMRRYTLEEKREERYGVLFGNRTRSLVGSCHIK